MLPSLRAVALRMRPRSCGNVAACAAGGAALRALRADGQAHVRNGCRAFSMPSRADTWPYMLSATSASAAAPAGYVQFSTRTAAGLFCGARGDKLQKKVQRAHALSHMVPAEALLRDVLARFGGAAAVAADERAAVVTLAEHTLSAVVRGGGSACVVRGGAVVAHANAAAGSGSLGLASFACALRLGDVVCLAPEDRPVDELLQLAADAADAGCDARSRVLLLRCETAERAEVWTPLGAEAPHASWVRTIFNEFGEHKEKVEKGGGQR
eukprot:TRINITY_DN21983_c0_g1_i1.p1 TRINITY_DN21983_c0_g1~~TRINITY_DN21983_c0_g1_i1.p1  ORF type:complete len:287 (-),score=71.37 TRINITY_DN21983_c0_g1_i1:37-840(-)